ncbi:MAG: hypothetical protein KZQ94_22490 [Candidatus Thiodiazotropha sp. (ex Troendleina suluensis)]|nr:hypothetical protein [Candidatus Thiodiazotropha sp. (ex Troendleina suluensis)]
MDAAGLIYIYYTAIILLGLVFVSLLLIIFYQYGNNKIINKKIVGIVIVLFAINLAVFWEPIVTTLIIIPSMCKDSGGLHVYKSVKAEGFFNNVFAGEYLTKYGYSFTEYVDYSHYRKRKFIKKIIGSSGDIMIGEVWDGQSPQSRYHYITRQRVQTKKTGAMKYLNIREEKDYILDTQSIEIMGEIIRYYYSGSEIRYAMHRMLAEKERTCWSSERDPKGKPLPIYVLKPS